MRYLVEIAQHNPWGLATVIAFALWVLVGALIELHPEARADSSRREDCRRG
jgi:hypothetical protein